MRRISICITMLLMFSPLMSVIFAQRVDDLQDIEAILGDDGRFLSPPIDIAEAALIGFIVPQAFDEYGVPQHLFHVRGEEAWQDDVVFFLQGFQVSLLVPGSGLAGAFRLSLFGKFVRREDGADERRGC